jgi:hypothetical protein
MIAADTEYNSEWSNEKDETRCENPVTWTNNFAYSFDRW